MSHTQVQLGRGTAAQIAAYTGPVGEVVLNTDDGSLNIQDGATAGGKFKVAATPTGSTPYSAPASGATITTAAGERRHIIDPAGTIAALTITLPPSPRDTDTWQGSTSRAITALTVTAPGGASVNGGAFLAAAHSGWAWEYRSANTTWYRRY